METAEEASEEAPSVSEEEVQAKVELAEAFAEMGDVEGAREILNEVMREGNDSQRSTAEEILQKYAS
jgi:pilus assembly protein FimV